MMAQYYQLVPSVSPSDDIKRIFTNLDNVQLVQIEDQSNSQFIIPQDESSYVLNDGTNQVQQLVYQQTPPQQKQTIATTQQQTYDPSSYLIQDNHESVVTSQHHQMQQTQHSQQGSLGQDNTQQIYYQTDSNQIVQTNQIMQHAQQPQQVIYQTVQPQSNPQPTQQQQILLHKSPDGRIRHIQTPQVMMTGSPINHTGQIEQQQQHVILQNQGNTQVLVQSPISQQQQTQSQHTTPMVAVRPQHRLFYKSPQVQLISYPTSEESTQPSHLQTHVQHSPQRYVQHQTQPQRILTQQGAQQHQQHQPQQQTHIMSPPTTPSNQQNKVFHQVQTQQKPANQMVPQLGSVQQSPPRLLTPGNMTSNIRLAQHNRLLLNTNNIRLSNPTGIRNQSPRGYVRTNTANNTVTSPILTPNIISSPRVTRPRASTPGTRGSRGGRGAKNITTGQVRMVSNAVTGTLQQRQTTIRNINPNISNNQFLPVTTTVKTYLTDSTGQIQLQQTGGQQRLLTYSDGSQQKLITNSTNNSVQLQTPNKGRTLSSTNKSSSQTQMSSQSDDIEDSIQPIFLSKSDVKADTDEIETDDANLQFDSNNISSYNQSEDDKKSNIGTNTMNLIEDKQRIKIGGRGFVPPNRNNQQNIPVNRVQPMPQQQSVQPQPKPQTDPGHVIQTQEIIQNRIQNQNQQDHSVDGIEKGNARMLVILASGEQRLITFTLPRDSCTVQELLEQVNVPFDSSTVIQCVSSKGANIDYVVTVGIPLPPPESRAEWIQNAEASLMLNKTDTSSSQQQQQQTQQPTQQASQQTQKSLNDSDKLEDIIPTKYIPGFYAVCKSCGNCSLDHAKCDRCKRVFVEEPKRYPFGAKTEKVTQNPHAQMSIEKRATLTSEMMGRATKTLATLTSGRGRGNSLTVTQRGRGRGGLRAANRQTEAAPVILTLSSDDEEQDDDKTLNQKMEGNDNLTTNLIPLQCEPVIPDVENEPNDTVRENVADLSNSADKMCTILTCKVIRIGSHKFQPKEKVTITSKGVRVIAPSCSNPEDNICLDIMHQEIVKVIAHLSKNLAVLFLYTLPRCGAYIRESLDMKAKNALSETPYYNPTDRAEPYKRIVIQIENLHEESRSIIRSIFPTTVLEFVGLDDAKELLSRSSSKDKAVKVESSGSILKLENDQNIRQILIYPPGKGGISINTEDYMCLAIDQYLNDVIIDFYMKYVHLHLPKEQQDKTHIFSTFFYKRLTTMTNRQRQSKEDAKLTAAQKRHARVASWTKNVNLFEKDFIIIPINEQSHWFLAIICFPKLKGPVSYDTLQPVSTEGITKKKKAHTERKISLQIGNTTITPLSKREYEAVTVGDDDSERDEAEGDESDLASDDSDFENGTNGSANNQVQTSQSQAIKQPMILIFDSLAGASRNRVVATLRDYLTCEYKAKCKDTPYVYHKLNMPGCSVKVPQQNNFTDCGLFVLQYTESFLKDPIKDYKIPIKQLVNWFENITVTKKREDIAILLKELVSKQHPERLPLPEIQLPTQDGKLIEYTEGEAEFEEDEMDEELDEEEEEEVPAATISPSEINNSKISANITPKPQILFKRSINEVNAGKSQESVMRKQIRLEEQNNLNSNSVNIGNKSNIILNINNTNTSVPP
ncbi:uncharacterized protein LOC129606736 [Condylostylus longicornis]|uniref:uncharacterized protein LOC129606736 n=1 Tax=Condylostylus longicornis TaxID=2530218 RepID=UPI00244DC370|nr:uncharacterized protein LOC129606736 [Condylostylus longicornis]XP_055373222.1 uncharacterized protein LOC129606736 [Condylostylus longicornis]